MHRSRLIALALLLVPACAAPDPGAARVAPARAPTPELTRATREGTSLRVRGALHLGARPGRTRLRVRSREGMVDVLPDVAGGFELLIPRGGMAIDAPDLPDAAAVRVSGRWVTTRDPFEGDRELGAALVVSARLRDREQLEPITPVLMGLPEVEADEGALGLLVIRLWPARVVSGRVLDGERRTGLQGAVVEVVADTPPTDDDSNAYDPAHWTQSSGRVLAACTSDALGRFRLALPVETEEERRARRDQGPGDDDPWLIARAAGRGACAARLQAEPIDLPLMPALALQGRVTDLDGGPLPATVRVCWRIPTAPTGAEGPASLEEVRSDAEGRLRIDGIPCGAASWYGGTAGPAHARIDLRVEHEGFDASFVKDVLVDATRAPVLAVELARLVDVRGVVLGPDGAPVVGVEVEGRGEDAQADARTDAEGRFALERVPERCRIDVARSDRAPAQAFLVRLPAPELVLRLDPAPPTITGRVVSADGAAISGARVRAGGEAVTDLAEPAAGEVVSLGPWRSADRWSEDARTGAEGRFEVATPGPEVELRLEHELWCEPLRATAGARDLTLVARRAAHVTFLVDAARPTPIELGVHDETRGGSTLFAMSHGSYHAPTSAGSWCPPGRHAVLVRAAGHAPVVRRFEVQGGERLELEPLVLVSGGGALELRVRWPTTPVLGLRAFVTDATGLESETCLHPPGLAGTPLRLDGLAVGTVTGRIRIIGAGDERRELPLRATVAEGGTTRVELDLR